jgi:hypothetical protein
MVVYFFESKINEPLLPKCYSNVKELLTKAKKIHRGRWIQLLYNIIFAFL